jgi:hypothetical protein
MSIRLNGIVRSNVCGAGNKMFQFFTALIYAEINNLYFDVDKTQFSEVMVDFSLINKNKVKRTEIFENMWLSSGHFDLNDNLRYFGAINYVVKDFFQNANYINKHFDIIMKYTRLRPGYILDNEPKLQYNINKNDFLCIVRMGALKAKELIHPDFFLDIIRSNSFDKIYFLFYPGNDCGIKYYLSFFNEYRDKIICLNNYNKYIDFYCVKHFENIGLCTSTYNWWSIFFLDEIDKKKIYTSKHFGQTRTNEKRHHVKNLGSIRNSTIITETKFLAPELNDTLNSLLGDSQNTPVRN